MIAIQAPTLCPSCSTILDSVNRVLYCRNTTCDAQQGKKMEHFAKAMRIKGLGPATLVKLDVTSIDELYELDVALIEALLNSERLAEKLFYELENSKDASLNRLLPAFAIPLIGKSAAEKLARVCENIFDIDDWTCRDAGLGEKTTRNLLDWINKNQQLIELLPFSFKFEKPKSTENRGIVCISGRLKSYKTKAEATEVLKSLGYTVKSSLTKDVMILVNEGGVESAKTLKARESGVIIVTNLKDFIGE